MRVNLAAALFPFATELWGRSVIIPGKDENYNRTIVSPVDQGKDRGLPQVFYMHNVLPSKEGFQAVGYDISIPALVGMTDFDESFPIQDVNNNRFLFSPGQGKNYIFDSNVGVWKSVTPFAVGSISSNTTISVTTVQRQSYICYPGFGVFYYDTATKSMLPAGITGITVTLIKGICEAFGYMLAWTDTTVYWSAAENPLDFTASVVTGANSGNLTPAHGKIVGILPLSNGFIVYCAQNAVSGKYTGNIDFPWAFNEVTSSGGLTSIENVSYQDNNNVHYAWTTSGFQSLDLNQANGIFPEVTEFLSKKIFEDFDEGTLQFSSIYTNNQLFVKVNAVSNKFLVLSYGKDTPGNYTHALVYDYVSDRWGKLKIPHVDVFQWNAPTLYGIVTYGMLPPRSYYDLGATTYGDFNSGVDTPELPLKTFSFLQADGTVRTVNFDLAGATADGVFVLGKYQETRNRFISHQYTDIEDVVNSDNFNFYVIPSLDGKTLLPAVPGFLQYNTARYRRYAKEVAGLNFSMLFLGAFNLVSVETDYTVDGEL